MPAPKDLDPTASLAALYGAKLRKLRTQAGWTQRELGDQIPITHSRIAQFELGHEVPSEAVSRKLDEVLGAEGELHELWVHAQRTQAPVWHRRLYSYEAKSAKMVKYQCQNIPGLLQTEAYMRALFNRAKPRLIPIEQAVAIRLGRRVILDRPNPPVMWAILDEAMLYRPVGGRATMFEQLAHLLKVQKASPHIAIQVLPFDVGAHPGLGGSLTVFSFARRPDVAYLENSHNGMLIEEPDDVAGYALTLDHLQSMALPTDESADLIRSVMETRYSMPDSSSHIRPAPWSKSSYSNSGPWTDCIEVSTDGGAANTVAVRDSKDPDGPMLVVDSVAWASFVTAVKQGDFPGI